LFDPIATARAGVAQSAGGRDVDRAFEEILQPAVEYGFEKTSRLVHVDEQIEIAVGPDEQAMALVRLLLGRAPEADGERQWTAAIAGGRRVVTLSEEANR
jgi:hypothetical protein